MNFSFRKQPTYSRFKEVVGKYYKGVPEKKREEAIKSKFKELFPDAKIKEDEPKKSNRQPPKDKHEGDSREVDKEK